jgi:PD-(D/E)XK nuclease superfamily protein
MTRIHLYNHVEDAWEANLANWLRQRSEQSFSGHETLFVTGSNFQANWIRRLALTQKIPLFGIQFLDCRSLRQHLCRLLGLPGQAFGWETLQMLLDSAAGKDNAENIVTQNLLYALDDLGASGYLDKVGLESLFSAFKIPEQLRPVIKELTSSMYWRPRVDAILLERMTQQNGLYLGLFGLDPESFGDLNLLFAAAKRAVQTEFWLAQPLGKEELMFQWISILEEKLKATTAVCPTGNARRPYETLLAHWQGGGELNVRPPEILHARGWYDQVEAIVHRVVTALLEHEQSVLVVVPENSATGNAVVHRLISCGIAVADEVREKKLLPLHSEVLKAIAQFLAEERTPECFIRIAQLLLRSPAEYLEFRRAFLRSFEKQQVRSVSALITEEHRQRFDWLRDLESALEPWPVAADWAEFRRRWESLLPRLATITQKYNASLVQIDSTTDRIEPLWHEIANLMQGRLLPSQVFLRFMVQLFAAQIREAHPASHHRYARVVVTTASKAYGTSWDCVVLADSISDLWPVAPPQNPIFNDEAKRQLRRQGCIVLTSAEQQQVQEERFLQLAYHSRRQLILARYKANDKGGEIVANNLATFVEEFLKGPLTNFQIRPPLVYDEAIKNFKEICASRVDREKPFDDHFLDFKSLSLPGRPWYPSELEMVFKTPATFAFKLMFNCQREFDRGFARSAPMTIGRVTHRLLQQAFGGGGEFQPFSQATQWSREETRAQLLDRVKMAYQKMHTSHTASGPDLWWNTILSKGLLFASRMLECVSECFEEGLWYQSEGMLQGSCPSRSGVLELEGRTDLILSDCNALDSAKILICDFKTSKQMPGFDSRTGDGLQFLGYRLLAQTNGALRIEVLIVKPDGASIVNFPPEDVLQDLADRLACLQCDRSFGRRPADRWSASEKLPIATLPIDADLLEAKLNLTWK